MAPAITPAVLKAFSSRIATRLNFVEKNDVIVMNAYEAIKSILESTFLESKDYAMTIAECFPPDILFHRNIAESEGRNFYSLLLDIVKATGSQVVQSRSTPMPMKLAKILYESPDSSEISAEDQLLEKQLMTAATKAYGLINIPLAPRSNDTIRSVRRNGLIELDRASFGSETIQEGNPGPEEALRVTTENIVGPSHQFAEPADNVPHAPRYTTEQMNSAIELQQGREMTTPPHRNGFEHPNEFSTRSHVQSHVSRTKSSFISTLMKMKEKAENLFTGTDRRSWASHLQNFIAMAKSHDIIAHDILFEMVQWTLGHGPKMCWQRYSKDSDAHWEGFLDVMNKKYNSCIVHARTRDEILAITLLNELKKPDEGPRSTRNSRAVTRTVNSILLLAKDLPEEERTDNHLLGFLRMAIRGVGFTKFAQISLANEETTFDDLSLSIQTAAQVEDTHLGASGSSAQSRTYTAHHTDVLSDLMDEIEPEQFEQYDVHYTDRRFGRVPNKRSKKCGNNKTQNGSWKGKVLQCYDCKSTKHLKFHKDCPAEAVRRAKGGTILSGVKRQLSHGAATAEVLMCLAIALEDATNAECSETVETTDLPEPIQVNFNRELDISREMQYNLDSDEELFENNFGERVAHSISGSLDHNIYHCKFNGKTSPGTTFIPSNAKVNGNVPVSFGTSLKVSCVHNASMSRNSRSAASFQGAVVDTGAAKSCIGLNQAKAYAAWSGKKIETEKSFHSFKFGDVVHRSLGKFDLTLPTPTGGISIAADIIAAEVPLLLGLDVLDHHYLLADTRINQLVHPDWTLPIVRDEGHLWVRWTSRVQYTKTQLEKLHRHYRHPSSSKLYALLKRVDGNNLPASTLQTLKEIQKSCDPCQVVDRKQMLFQVGSADSSDIVFNREIAMDILKIDGKSLLHVIDVGTHFGAAKFLDSEDTQSVWKALMQCWVLVYAGQPDIYFTDQGSVFTSEEWQKLADEDGVVLKFSGVQHHNGISICERYHGPLRAIYRKVEIECPNMEPDFILQTSVKAMNDVMGPEGLVPSMLVFGIMPRYSPAGMGAVLPSQTERIRAINTARDSFFRIVNKLRIQRALRSRIPQSADISYKEGDLVRVYREDTNGYSEPVKIVSVDESTKMVTVEFKPGLLQLYSITQVKPYHGAPAEAEKTVENISSGIGPWCRNYVRRDSFQVNVTEVIEGRDPRSKSPKMMAAIDKEIKGLMDRGTFKIVLKEEVPENANILKGRMLLSIKDANTNEERYKARFVIGGHRDKDKASLVHASPNLRQDSARMLLAIASIMGFEVWTEDIAQAYLQSSTDLMREIYLDASKEFCLNPGQILRLMKPLYGLSDSGDRWHYTLKSHHLKDLQMIPTTGDISLYAKHIGERLSGLSGIYVDDTLQTGDEDFKKWTQKTGQRFDSTPRKYGSAKFAGMEFCQNENRDEITINMSNYIKKLELVSVPCFFDVYRSTRAQLAWTVHCRPDVACAVAMCSQVTEKMFDPIEDSKQLNRITRHLKKHDLKIKYPKLDRKSLHIRAYADASHANNRDLSSQLGIVITLCDSSNKCSVIAFRSYKCQRITRSALASECHALADCFDFAMMMKHDLESVFRQSIPIQMMTDSKSLFDVIVKSGKTAERRIMIDIEACRQAYERFEIADIGLVSSEYNLADCMTKIMLPKQLMDVMSSGHLNHPIKQWIIRTEEES